MGNKNSRAGGKFTGTHTTLSAAAAAIADIAHACSAVTRISPGFLKAGLPSVHGKKRLKITNEGSRLLLSVRDNTTNQEVHLYTTSVEDAIDVITHDARAAGFAVSVVHT